MAEKDKELKDLNDAKGDDDDVSMDDFDDFDFGDFDSMGGEEKSRSPVANFKKGLTDDLKGSLTSGTNIYNVIEGATNKSFKNTGAVFDTVNDATDMLSTLRDDISKELAPGVNALRQITRKVLPISDRFLPDSISKAVKDFSTPPASDDDQKRTVEEIRNDEIKDHFQSLFGDKEKIDQQKFKYEQAQKMIDRQYTNKKNSTQLTLLAQIKEILTEELQILIYHGQALETIYIV
jgi:hypothetical protein